jgi:hypothetical protein
MASSFPQSSHLSDVDLLERAIPIDPNEVDEDDDNAEAPQAAGQGELQPIDIAARSDDASDGKAGKSSKIKAFGERRPHEDQWQRQPNVTGQGAIHCKTFVAKLRYDAIEHLDEQVNHWLDNHPEYEVKFVTTTVGTLRGKLMEEALFMNVWV